MKNSLKRFPTPTSLLVDLIESPDLVRTIQTVSPHTFSAIIKRVGIEDAGEIVAVATTEQIVTAFDEDLFTNRRPGEREAFDVNRFIVWLEVLLQAGDDVAARRFSELSEQFVVQALSSILLVLDYGVAGLARQLKPQENLKMLYLAIDPVCDQTRSHRALSAQGRTTTFRSC